MDIDPNRSLSRKEFRYVENISPAKFYKLKKRGLTPDEINVDGLARITPEAHAKWRPSWRSPRLRSSKPSAGANWPLPPAALLRCHPDTYPNKNGKNGHAADASAPPSSPPRPPQPKQSGIHQRGPEQRPASSASHRSRSTGGLGRVRYGSPSKCTAGGVVPYAEHQPRLAGATVEQN